MYYQGDANHREMCLLFTMQQSCNFRSVTKFDRTFIVTHSALPHHNRA